MNKIKSYDQYHLIMEFTRKDSDRVISLFDSIKDEDEVIKKDITDKVNTWIIDPYCNFNQIIDRLEFYYKDNTKVLNIIKANKNN